MFIFIIIIEVPIFNSRNQSSDVGNDSDIQASRKGHKRNSYFFRWGGCHQKQIQKCQHLICPFFAETFQVKRGQHVMPNAAIFWSGAATGCCPEISAGQTLYIAVGVHSETCMAGVSYQLYRPIDLPPIHLATCGRCTTMKCHLFTSCTPSELSPSTARNRHLALWEVFTTRKGRIRHQPS